MKSIRALLLRRAVWMLAWLLLAPLGGFARDSVVLDSRNQPVHLGTAGETWMDPTGQANVDTVARDTGLPWQPASDGHIYPLSTTRALWVRFTMPPSTDGERWYLEIPYASLDRATLFSPAAGGGWTAQSAGDTLPLAQWPVAHRHPLLPLAYAPNESRTYLVRIANAHSFSAPLQFTSESHLSRTEQRISLILGMYFGLGTLACLLATISSITLRDKAYALYAVSVALLGLTQAAITGFAALHLWPEWPWWNNASSLVLPVLGVGAVQWFFAAVIALRERSRRLNAMVTVCALLSIPTAIAIMAVEPSLRFKLMVPYIVVATNLGMVAVLWALRRGDRYAGWVLAGSLPVAIGAAFPLARTAGLIPVSFWTMHGMQIGIAIELPVLLVMLMLRSQHRREHHRRVQGLDRIDPATGLINAHVFHERLVRLIARSQRLKMRSAILIVDLVNLDHIRTRFDDASARELPLHVAGRLLSVAREIDSVARLSDHRFGLLLEGPLKADEVAEAGPRVVARCLMPFKNRPLEWAAQVRVAQALIPMDGTDPDQVVGQLEALLASVPADSKRAVFLLNRANAPAPASATMLTTP